MNAKTMKKRTLCILLIIGLVFSLTACGEKGNSTVPMDDETNPSEDATPAMITEPYNTGSFKVSVPEGWKAFPQHDVFNDDPDAMNPNLLMVAKGATSDMDVYSKPCITISYGGPGTTLMSPSRDFYDDVKDLPNITSGGHNWEAFQCTSVGQKLYMLFEDLGTVQFQISVAYDTNGGTISLDDADVQSILASIASSDGSGSTQGTNAPTGVSAAYDADWWEGGWYGWWAIKNGTGVYQDASDRKLCWDAYAEIDVYNDDTGRVTLWDATDTTKDDPFIRAYDVKFEGGLSELGRLTSTRIDIFPSGIWLSALPCVPTSERSVGWTVDPADSTVSHFENMIEIVGRYESPENVEDAFDYYIYLRPWGTDWEDVRNGNTEGCLYKDMMPSYHDNWYRSLLALSYTSPVSSFQEGIDIINKYLENQGSGDAGTGGALNPADKAGATGEVDIATLKKCLPQVKSSAVSYSTTYDEIAAIFGVHGQSKKSLFEGKSIYRWWAPGDAYIEITFDIQSDGTETWNVTAYDGLE